MIVIGTMDEKIVLKSLLNEMKTVITFEFEIGSLVKKFYIGIGLGRSFGLSNCVSFVIFNLVKIPV